MSSKYSTGTAGWLFGCCLALASACNNHDAGAVAAPPAPPTPPGASAKEPLTELAERSQRLPASNLPALLSAEELTWSYPETAVGPMQVVVSLPERRPGDRFPVLFAFHGRGEALKGAVRGARGWIDDYGLLKAIGELQRAPLEHELFLGFADPKRLERMNESLRAKRYGGLIVVMPYTPDRLGGEDAFLAARPLGEFVLKVLLPRVYRETPALGTPESTGIDGVSLGGRAALGIGLAQPKSFGVVAGIQAAFDVEEGELVARFAKAAYTQNPQVTLRLLTSQKDYYLASLRALGDRLEREGVPHRLDVVRGTHSYTFNRGAGVYEMLLFHDRALRRESPP